MNRLSFSNDSRLKKSREFDGVYRQGIRLHGRGFSLICLANGHEQSRIGISVHRKIRGAVRRNRIKRIIREAFRLYRHSFPDRADIVFTVRPDFELPSPLAIREAAAVLTAKWKARHEG